MGIIGLIVGTLAAGSGLMMLMTWLEGSLYASPAIPEPTDSQVDPVRDGEQD